MFGYDQIGAVLRGDKAIGSEVEVRGWVRTRRATKGGVSFVNLYDGSSFSPIQIVIPDAIENAEELARLTTGCAVRATGEVVASPGAGQSVEIAAKSVEVVGWVEDPETYPMAPKRHSMEHLRAHAHLRPRTNLIGAVTRVRHALARAIHAFFDEHGFAWIPDADRDRLGRRGRRRDVPRLDARRGEPAVH